MQSKTYLSNLVLALLLVACVSNKDRKAVEIPEGKVGMIGYGSLISIRSIEETLQRRYSDSIFYIHLNGFYRDWSFSGANNDPELPEDLLQYDGYYIDNEDTLLFDRTVFLNIKEDADSRINCVLYFVTMEELLKFDQLEMGYERINVANKIEEFQILNGPVYAYKALPDYEFNPEDSSVNIIEKAYHDLVLQACDSIGSDYRREFDATTKPYDPAVKVAPVIRRKVR